MACDHFGPRDARNDWKIPGIFVIASFDGGECSRGGHDLEEGMSIRADGDGGWECRECVEADGGLVEIEVEDEWDPFS